MGGIALNEVLHTFAQHKNTAQMRRYISLFLLLLGLQTSYAQKRQTYEEYIHKYKNLAIEEMMRYRIPASITLAQGLLESGAGNSELARKSNNHFGIKCGGSWEGPSVRHTDDAPNECFRAYRHPKESYEDHSKFLVTRPRYAFLFQLSPTDYRGWARGLKKAGYATDPGYAEKLIGIIENYRLYQYDTKRRRGADEHIEYHQPYLANDLLYILARPGDTFKLIAKEFDMSRRKLARYNELPKNHEFEGGEVVYLEMKRDRATPEHIIYKVKDGDSMHSIAQTYGIKLKRLYKMNEMTPEDDMPPVGSFMRLR